jgi:RNA polymerase sigma-70 factor, ECF subfamily
MDIPAAHLARPLVRSASADRPIEAQMDRREFDYDAIIKPMESRMMRSIWRIVRKREEAEDALQEALTIIWKKRDAIARHVKPEALILRISVNAAYDVLRRMQRRLHHEVPGLPEQPADPARTSTEIEDRAIRAGVLEAIGRLPRRQAVAVLLRIVEERPYEDIARSMNCTEATVRIHVMRGRAALVRSLAHLRPGIKEGIS